MSADVASASAAGADYEAALARLLAIWSATLRTKDISPDSNFFDLGGDSLLALSLFLAIEAETGVRLPITAIYDAPTVGEMAELLVAGRRPRFSPLVLLRPGESVAPLFVIHGIGGTVVELSALAQSIPVAAPVYALQARGIDGSEEPLDSVEAMADLYLDCIRQTQPHGPYAICGYSFGGIVAIEIARRLKRLRQDIALLILMDAFAHPATWPFRARASMRLRRMKFRLREAARQPWRKGLPMLRAAAGRVLRRLFLSDAHTRSRIRVWQFETNPELTPSLVKVREAAGAALAAYVPRFYPGKIVFLKAARRDLDFPIDPVPVWRHLVEELDVRTVPGGHLTIVSAHAADAGSALGACIREAGVDREPRVPPLGSRRTSSRLKAQAISA